MPGEPPLALLEAELHGLALALDGGEENRMATLRKIFAVNNEIGKILRANPEMRPELLELQSWINTITIGVKSSDPRRAVGGLKESLRLFDGISRGQRRSQKNL